MSIYHEARRKRETTRPPSKVRVQLPPLEADRLEGLRLGSLSVREKLLARSLEGKMPQHPPPRRVAAAMYAQRMPATISRVQPVAPPHATHVPTVPPTDLSRTGFWDAHVERRRVQYGFSRNEQTLYDFSD
jgi:hypothetical protein